jgi:hypothetical protein
MFDTISPRSAWARWWKGPALAIGIVLGLLVSTGQPAQAAPYWQTFTLSSNWHCSGRLSSPTSIADIRVCVVINGNYAQAVTRIRNTTSSWIDIVSDPTALIENGSTAAIDSCNVSSLGAHLERACFGATVQGACGDIIYADTYSEVRKTGGGWSTASGWTDDFWYCY